MLAWSEDGLAVVRLPLDGTPSQPVAPALLAGPVQDMKFDAQGNLFVLEQETSRITVLDSGLERVLARMGGRDSRLQATHLSVDAVGNAYVANLEDGRTMAYRWDARLPALETLRVELAADGAAFSWDAVESNYLWGYRVAGSPSRQGPFTTLATTTEQSFDLTMGEDFPYGWLRVDPVSIAGSASSSDQPVPVAHRVAREAAARGALAEVLDAATRAESLAAQGVLSLSTEVAQEMQWHAFATEFQMGRYEEAAAREEALDGWEGEDGGVELHRLLALANVNLNQHGPALANARQALEAMPARERAGEIGAELLQLGITSAVEVGAFQDVVTLGEELQGRVEPDREFQLFARLAAGYLALDNPQRTLQIAMAVLDRDRAGAIVAYDDDRPDLYWAAFQASLGVADAALMELWSAEFAPYVAGERRRPYYAAQSRFSASQGEGEQARTHFLELLNPAPEPDFYADPEIVGLTFDVFRALQDEDTEGRTAGLAFLAQYVVDLPAEVENLSLAYEDSIAVFTPREETRARLGEGFQYWREANFVQMMRFFRELIEVGGLTPEQEIISRGLLAGALRSAGLNDDAESTYRGILDLEPLFDIDEMVARVEALYGVTVFDQQSIEVFRNVRGIR